MNDEDFQRLVQKALKNIPHEFLELMDNVSIVTQGWPNRSQISELYKRGKRGLLLGLYHGVPKVRRGGYGIGGQLPDKITIFKNSILLIAKTQEEVIKIVEDTVIHEIAHHFGLSDDDLDKIKMGKH